MMKKEAHEAWKEYYMEEGREQGEEKATGNMILEFIKAKQPISLIMQVTKYSAERIAEFGRINGIPLLN